MTDIAEPFQIVSKIYDNPIEAEKDFRFKREVFSQKNKGLKIIRCKPEIESNKDYDKGLTQYRMSMRGLYIKDGENKWEYQYPLLANLEEEMEKLLVDIEAIELVHYYGLKPFGNIDD